MPLDPKGPPIPSFLTADGHDLTRHNGPLYFIHDDRYVWSTHKWNLILARSEYKDEKSLEVRVERGSVGPDCKPEDVYATEAAATKVLAQRLRDRAAELEAKVNKEQATP